MLAIIHEDHPCTEDRCSRSYFRSLSLVIALHHTFSEIAQKDVGSCMISSLFA
jgi:hypothetical protein